MRISEVRTFKCDARICVLPKVNEHLAVGKPSTMVLGLLLQNAPHLLTSALESSVTPTGASEIHPSLEKLGCKTERPFERRQADSDLIEREFRGTQKPETPGIVRSLLLELTQDAFCGCRLSSTQCHVRPAETHLE